MIYFADFMIHTLLKDLFLARNYILLKQRKGSLQKKTKKKCDIQGVRAILNSRRPS